jgi:peptidoglycan/LPS O-acetylase OafA/YrhL
MRLVQLDILRAVAVLMVLGRHMGPVPETLPRFIALPLRLWSGAGWAGVDLFFVLSGFLIGGLLFGEHRRRGTIRIGRFLTRRALKIYPAFYAMILATVGYGYLTATPVSPRNLIPELLFVQNYFTGLWQHTWSLAVEEHFYILLPLVLLLRLRSPATKSLADPFRSLLPWIAGVLLLVLALRFATSLRIHDRFSPHIFYTHLRIDALLFGVVLAYFFNFHAEHLATFVRRYRWPLLVLAIALLSPCAVVPITGFYMQTIGFTCTYLAFGAVVLLAVHTPLPRSRLASSFLTLVGAAGAFSYSIYLWHLPVQHWVVPAISRLGLPTHFVFQLALYIGLSIGVGILLSKLIEMPVLALRDRLFPSTAGAVALPANVSTSSSVS